MAASQGRSQTHALAAAPLPRGTPRHTPTFKAFLLFPRRRPAQRNLMASPLGDRPGSQRPPANSCPVPASPGDPSPLPSWGPAPSARHEPSRGRGGSGCNWPPPRDWGRTVLGRSRPPQAVRRGLCPGGLNQQQVSVPPPGLLCY